MDLNVLSNYLVIVIVGICCCIGYIIKTSLDFIPNKYIPLLMGVIGCALNVWIAGALSPEVILGGLFSGLAATGLHQSFKNLIEQDKVNK